MSFHDYKVLPFDAAQGRVPGHEIRTHHYSWMGECNGIKSVVVEKFDQTAQMPVEHVIHWTRWTQYMKKYWPSCGSVVAVILNDGRRVHAQSLYANHDDRSYEAAPILCRDAISINMMGGRDPLMEIVGVREWLWKRTPMECPWERDNRAFNEGRMVQSA